MRKVFVEPVVLPEPRFRDGLGIRYVRTDVTDDPVEVLRPLWDVGAMQAPIRQRVGRLASFRQARFVPVRSADVPLDDSTTIEVVSDYVSGYRLSQYLEASQTGAVSIETSTVIYILRELLGALALLHESRGLTHGAVGPERIIITPKGRVVVADYVLGPAIERLEFTRPRLWREFRIPLPAGKGLPKLDDLADVVQVGATAVALLAGRQLEVAEYPDGLDELVASVGQARIGTREPAVPAPLIGWLKRALAKDQNGKFANVRDARLALETALSKQHVATGGATALKALAETFGRLAAQREAAAKAEAAEQARKAALAAIQASIATDEAASTPTESVAAFTLLPDEAAGSPGIALPEVTLDALPAPVADTEPPVGWRVPEPTPVEETLPTSALLQMDAATEAPPVEEFDEEVLDLTDLAGTDDSEIVGASVGADAPMDSHCLADAEAVAPVVPPLPEAIVAASPADSVVVAGSVEGTPSEGPAEPISEIEEPLLQPRAVETEPDWRVLGDPEGANAPTIELEVPTATLEDLVAEFAAVVAVEGVRTEPADEPVLVIDAPAALVDEPPAPVDAPPALADGPAALVVEPAAMLDALVATATEPVETAPEASAMADAAAETGAPDTPAFVEAAAPPALAPSALDLVLTLQDAQAQAQAAVDAVPEPSAGDDDVRAWSFVEELLHHDSRFEQPAEAESLPPAVPVEEEAPAPVAFAEAGPDIALSSAPEEHPAASPEEIVSLDPAPLAERGAPSLPADWLIELETGNVEPTPDPVSAPASEQTPESTLAPPAAQEWAPAVHAEQFWSSSSAAPTAAPTAARQVAPPVPEEDLEEPIFPRVAPSVRRVRAEARQRRLARFQSAVSHGVRSAFGACAAAVTAVASGLLHSLLAVGRGIAAGVRTAAAGGIFAATAVSRGIAGAIHAVASFSARAIGGAASVVAAVGHGGVVLASAIASGARKLARETADALGSATRLMLAGIGRGLRGAVAAAAASAQVAAKAVGSVARSCGGAMLTAVRALSAGLRSLGHALRGGVDVGLMATGRAARALASATAASARWVGRCSVSAFNAAARVMAGAASFASGAGARAGRGAASAGKEIGAAASTVPRKAYFAASDLLEYLPRPTFRPWYLGAALLVIVAAAGLPFARARWFTAKPALGMIRVESAQSGALVTIDGIPQGRAPVTATVPVGRHHVEVGGGGRTRTHDVDVAADRETIVRAAASGVAGAGTIRVTSDPAGAEVRVDGVLHGTAPLTIGDVTEGTHTIEVRDASGLVRQSVRVKADESVDASLQIRPGWLAVFAPVKLDILENGRSIGSTERGRILTPPGVHALELVSQVLGFRETRQVEVKPGEVAALTIQMPAVSIEVVAPAEAEIFVDGQPAGTAPVQPLRVAVGMREITMRHPTLGERRQVVSVTYNSPVRVVFE